MLPRCEGDNAKKVPLCDWILWFCSQAPSWLGVQVKGRFLPVPLHGWSGLKWNIQADKCFYKGQIINCKPTVSWAEEKSKCLSTIYRFSLATRRKRSLSEPSRPGVYKLLSALQGAGIRGSARKQTAFPTSQEIWVLSRGHSALEQRKAKTISTGTKSRMHLYFGSTQIQWEHQRVNYFKGKMRPTCRPGNTYHGVGPGREMRFWSPLAACVCGNPNPRLPAEEPAFSPRRMEGGWGEKSWRFCSFFTQCRRAAKFRRCGQGKG